ncbi:sulfatase-like hydrolase/transferase [Pseudomonas sp. CAU 1711]|uniref:sulfatase-like hydrolase/transferase n=1 Tax=Pseudomonas sp. CAU 1711 TaxID=3140356 RepID=UPI003260CD54
MSAERYSPNDRPLATWKLWLTGSSFLLLFSLLYLLFTTAPKLRILLQTWVYESIFDGRLLLSQFGLDMLWFAVAFTLPHLMLGALVLACWRWLSPHWLSRERSGYGLLLVWGVILALLANRCFFPQSFFSAGEEAGSGFWILLWVGLALWLVLLLGGGLMRKPVWGLALVGILGVWLPWKDQVPSRDGQTAERQHPDIIIIGFDSLRPDVVGDTYTPHLQGYLRQAVLYPRAITPLAHTYPAWMSILTGVYPSRHGARFNLIPDSFLNPQYRTLPQYLKTLGYQTLLAMDERRFANISSRHGFDRIVGPDVGAGDFLLGTASDTPILNFIRQTPAARHLFPYIHNNRAAYNSYRGAVFVDAMAAALNDIPDDTPAFAAIHFCMAHWPYAIVPQSALEEERFKHFSPAVYSDEYYLNYLKAVSEADEQFGRTMAELKSSGRLDNALVFFISDHGESFSTDALDLIGTGKSKERWQLSINGHGTHATLAAQYQVLLAMQAYQKGRPTLSGTRLPITNTVGLIDILPTALDYLDLSAEPEPDGRSLLRPALGERDFFVESGFSVPAILNNSPDPDKALQQGIGYYRVRSSGEIELKPKWIPTLIERKEYSHLGKADMLTYGSFGEDRVGFRLLDLHNSTWQEVTGTAPAELVARALKLCRQFSEDPRLAHEPICRQQVALKNIRHGTAPGGRETPLRP